MFCGLSPFYKTRAITYLARLVTTKLVASSSLPTHTKCHCCAIYCDLRTGKQQTLWAFLWPPCVLNNSRAKIFHFPGDIEVPNQKVQSDRSVTLITYIRYHAWKSDELYLSSGHVSCKAPEHCHLSLHISPQTWTYYLIRCYNTATHQACTTCWSNELSNFARIPRATSHCPE